MCRDSDYFRSMPVIFLNSLSTPDALLLLILTPLVVEATTLQMSPYIFRFSRLYDRVLGTGRRAAWQRILS